MIEKSTSEIISNLLDQWGFPTTAPDSLISHASLCAACMGKGVAATVSAVSLIEESEIAGVLASRPTNVLPLDHLETNFPALREHSLKITSILRGIAYFSDIPFEFVDPYATATSKLRPYLDKYNSVLIRTSSGSPMLIFADINSLLIFSQMGLAEKLNDPIRSELGQEPIVGLASSAIVSRAAKAEATSNVQVVSAVSQDNYFTASQAKTDGERILTRILDEALMRRATDVEFAPSRDGTSNLRFRIFGDMTKPERNASLSADVAKEIINFLIARSRAGDGGRLRKAADGQMTYKNSSVEVFIRASFIPADRSGTDYDMNSVSLRLMPKTTRSIQLKQLNIPDVVTDQITAALTKSQGLIVLAGPTNSGKSTTIAGVVGEHIRLYGNSKKRLSLEDPVERYLEGITQISVDNNFAELIRALLRHDPDLIWVGEIRDAFSAAACVRAATSGHIVLSTVHANNSILAFRAVSNYLRKDTGEATGGGASLFDLAESVSLLIGQRLVKRLCPHCKTRHNVTKDDMSVISQYLKFEGQEVLVDRALAVLKKPTFRARLKGCAECSHTGYAGEMPIAEVLPGSREVRSLFSQSEHKLDFAKLSAHRLNSLAESALNLIEQGECEHSAIFV